MEKTVENIGSVRNSPQIPSELISSQIASELKMLPLYIDRAFRMTDLPEFSQKFKVTAEQQEDLIGSLNRRITELYSFAKKLKDRTRVQKTTSAHQ
jgi:hypothetical protein